MGTGDWLSDISIPYVFPLSPRLHAALLPYLFPFSSPVTLHLLLFWTTFQEPLWSAEMDRWMAPQLRFTQPAPSWGPRAAERVVICSQQICSHWHQFPFFLIISSGSNFSWPAYKKQAVGTLWGHILWRLSEKEGLQPPYLCLLL